MIWHKNYVRPTAFEKLRMDAMVKGGCILSMWRMERGLEVPDRGKIEVHHLKTGTSQAGWWFTIPLRIYYHRGVVPYPATSTEEAQARYGAALSDGGKTFRASHDIDDWGLWDWLQPKLGMSAERPASKIYKAPVTEAEVSS